MTRIVQVREVFIASNLGRGDMVDQTSAMETALIAVSTLGSVRSLMLAREVEADPSKLAAILGRKCSCGAEISEARLRAKPDVRTCIGCARRSPSSK